MPAWMAGLPLSPALAFPSGGLAESKGTGNVLWCLGTARVGRRAGGLQTSMSDLSSAGLASSRQGGRELAFSLGRNLGMKRERLRGLMVVRKGRRGRTGLCIEGEEHGS